VLWAAQLMYLRRHKLAARVEGDLMRMQQDIDAGLRVEFQVKPEVMGLVVGFRGQNVTRVTQVRLPLTS
jgi:transcription antitermination factor NusA-like protein